MLDIYDYEGWFSEDEDEDTNKNEDYNSKQSINKASNIISLNNSWNFIQTKK